MMEAILGRAGKLLGDPFAAQELLPPMNEAGGPNTMPTFLLADRDCSLQASSRSR